MVYPDDCMNTLKKKVISLHIKAVFMPFKKVRSWNFLFILGIFNCNIQDVLFLMTHILDIKKLEGFPLLKKSTL